jgi:hypothetical protein
MRERVVSKTHASPRQTVAHLLVFHKSAGCSGVAVRHGAIEKKFET